MSDEKLTHEAVAYEHPAKGMDHCRACRHFEDGFPPACEIVKSPIRAGDWCDRFRAKEKKS